VRRGLVTLAVIASVAVTLAFARLFDSVPGLTVTDRTRAGLIAGSVFGGLLVLVGRRVWLPVMERIDQSFFRGSYDARRLLVTLAEQSRTATDRTTLAELIDNSVAQALHPQTLLVFLRGDEDWTFDAAAHEGLAGDAARLPASPVQLAELARRGRPVLIAPEQLLDGGTWASLAPLRPETLVPLVGRSRQLEGLLVLGPRLSEEPYSGEDISLLASVGTQAGLALENIRLAETMVERIEAERRVSRELEIAREVQAKLLPQNHPDLETLDYAGACLQARIVGGDYFDFVSLAPQQFGLVLADISGKGISAALLMASLQANLRAQYANAPDDLTKVLSLVNKVFFDSTAANHYATLFFGVYEESARRLRFANCGHLPPILLRAGGEVERLAATAPVVGLFEEPWACSTGACDLAPGDTLVVFTDGVSEATADNDEEFGEERLIALVKEHKSLPASELLDAIVRAVREHSTQEQFDDLTLIVAHVR
jgi:phosphoserine phosphatase RsbU/P